ncbi:MAG: DUF981 family protein [Flavobacterium sp.]|uniref:Uncharacterized membrane protein n=1 Tax=Myroides marinus TaxID=703342 RepID=A0A163ZI74_9FLAO|nr:DUF981 family protein [Myroides marinus]KZE81818.1 hypothetical protein AV926_00480 [Myroides marinus]SEI82509.1 Uncharacterized membrane protein [Myroides marinus]
MDKLIIDWQQLPTYNTVMAVASGAALLSLATIGRSLINNQKVNPKGWAMNLFTLALILITTGLHMTVTWPLAKYFPFDNIIFGEPSLVLGAMLLPIAYYFWKHEKDVVENENRMQAIAANFRHFKYLMIGIGLGMIGIAFAGVIYQLFAAPKEEPISGMFADYPMFEAVCISLVYAGIGIAAVIMPSTLEKLTQGNHNNNTVKFAYFLLTLVGWVWLLFGALNYFTHIGLIVNTMG